MRVAQTKRIITKKEIRESLFLQCLGAIINDGPITTGELLDLAEDKAWVLPWSIRSQRRSGLNNLFHSVLQPHANRLIRNTTEGWMLESKCDDAVRAGTQNRRLRDAKGRLISVGEDINNTENRGRIQDDLGVLLDMFDDLFEMGWAATPDDE